MPKNSPRKTEREYLKRKDLPLSANRIYQTEATIIKIDVVLVYLRKEKRI